MNTSDFVLSPERFEALKRLNRYQCFTGPISIYPGAGTGSPAAVTYALFGLLGETGEVVGAGTTLSAPVDTASTQPTPLENLKKELGDVGFYLARLSLESGLKFSVVGAETPADDGSTDLPTMLSTLVRNTSALAEMAKKALRDDEGLEVIGHAPGTEMTERARKWLDQLRLAYQAWAAICARFFTVDAVLEANQAKLESRRDRGVLKGSGDNR